MSDKCMVTIVTHALFLHEVYQAICYHARIACLSGLVDTINHSEWKRSHAKLREMYVGW